MTGHDNVIKEYFDMLPLVSPKERAELLAITFEGESLISKALQEGRLEVVEHYIEAVRNVAPELSPEARSGLLKYMRESHAMLQPLGLWIDSSSHWVSNIQSPDVDAWFKKMEDALESGSIAP